MECFNHVYDVIRIDLFDCRTQKSRKLASMLLSMFSKFRIAFKNTFLAIRVLFNAVDNRLYAM